MKIIVQKFGGTSLRNDTQRRQAVKHIKAAVLKKYKVVVVVSAMGRQGDPYATDSLLNLLNPKDPLVHPGFSKRETDLLMSCGEVISAVVLSHLLFQMQTNAVVLAGIHAGIITNAEFNNAKIIEVNVQHIQRALKEHDVVIIPGFQGMTETAHVTTLGRGGSDTSAAALGAALASRYIDIFTDVEGVMTADPMIVNNARPLQVMTYTEVCNLAYQGVKVIHPRAVEIAKAAHIPIRIRSTFSMALGTLVTNKVEKETKWNVTERPVTGIAYVKDIAQIKVEITKVPQHLQFDIFKAMAKEGISVDFINVNPNSVSYTVASNVLEVAVRAVKDLGYDPIVETNCAKVSAVGAGMSGVPGIAAKIITALTNQNIQILQTADSYTTIWILVKQRDLNQAINTLHTTFQLNNSV